MENDLTIFRSLLEENKPLCWELLASSFQGGYVVGLGSGIIRNDIPYSSGDVFIIDFLLCGRTANTVSYAGVVQMNDMICIDSVSAGLAADGRNASCTHASSTPGPATSVTCGHVLIDFALRWLSTCLSEALVRRAHWNLGWIQPGGPGPWLGLVRKI